METVTLMHAARTLTLADRVLFWSFVIMTGYLAAYTWKAKRAGDTMWWEGAALTATLAIVCTLLFQSLALLRV